MMFASAASDQEKPAAPVGARPDETGLLDQSRSLWRDLRALVHDELALAALEAKLAGKSLVSMIVTGVMVAGLLLSTWLALVGVAALWLVSAGVPPTLALLFAAAANLALALVCFERIRRQARNLQFVRTIRGLRAPSSTPAPGQS